MAERMDVLRLRAGAAHGTGFLVARDRLLTALHVVGRVDGDALVLHGSIEVIARVRRGDGFARLVTRLGDDAIVAFERDHDWVCFAIDPDSIAGTAVWPIGGEPPATHDRWETFGFPASAPDDGKGTTGSVTSPTVPTRVGSTQVGLIQLYSREAAAGLGGQVHGYSGAPMIVRGRAIGVLSAAATTWAGRSDEGTLYAVPLASIAGRLGLTLDVPAPLPVGLGYPPAPYRGLLRYTRAEARVFFGRDREIAAALAAITASDGGLVLLTGPAGSGKSSLLEAGVRPRLEATHALAVERVERGDLRGAWARATGGDWLAREAELDRPLVVVLDQLEDAWRDGGDELRAWIRADVGRCFDAGGNWRPRGRLVLSFRKEWIGEIQGVLLDTGLGRWRSIQLAPLDRAAIGAIVRGVDGLDAYRIAVEPDLAERMADALLADADAPRAPTLQVWLTELYQRDPHRLAITDFARLVRDGAGLGDFLDRQLATAPADAVDSGLALDLLAFHVGPLATAIGRTHAERVAAYAHVDHAALLDALERARLLIPLADRTGYRLVHDTLAPVVLARCAASFRPAQRARQILDGQRLEWRAGPATGDARGRLAPRLDARLLEIVLAGTAAMRAVDADDRALIEASVAAQRARDAGRAIDDDPGRAIALVLDAPGPVASPALDQVARGLDRVPWLRPLADFAPTAIAIAADGSLAALADGARVWLIPTADPATAFSLDAGVAVTSLAVSRGGRHVACASTTALCSFAVDTGARFAFEGSADPSDRLFVSDGGDVAVARTSALFVFRAGVAAQAWAKRRNTDDTWIYAVHGFTAGTPYLVCEQQYGERHFVAWYDLAGVPGTHAVGEAITVAMHPSAPRITLAEEESSKRWRLTDLDLATPEIDEAHAQFPLRGAERILALRLVGDAQVRWLLTPYRLVRIEAGVAERREMQFGSLLDDAVDAWLGAAGEHALIHVVDKGQPRTFAVEVGRSVLALGRLGRLVGSSRPGAVAQVRDRPFLVAPDARMPSTAMFGLPASAVAAACLTAPAGDATIHAIAMCDAEGAIVVLDREPRRFPSQTALEAGEAVVGLAGDGGSAWFAITDRRRMLTTTALTLQGPEVVREVPPATLALSPDRRWLVAGAAGNPNHAWPLQLWNVGAAGPRARRPLALGADNLGGAGPHVAFSPDGRWLATSTDDPVVLLWELGSEPVLRRSFHDRSAGFADVTRWVLALGFTEDGRLAVVWDSARIDLFELDGVEPIASHRSDGAGDADRAILSPSGRWCVVDWHDGRWLFSLRELARRVRLPRADSPDELIAIDDRARWLLTGRGPDRYLQPIDPFGDERAPEALGSPKWAWLAPGGDRLFLLTETGALTRIRLDAARALRDTVVCR